MSLKTKSYWLGLPVILLALSACETVTPPVSRSSELFHPAVIILVKGQPIQTAEGVFTPVVNCRYYSEKEYQDLELKLLDALRVIANEKMVHER